MKRASICLYLSVCLIASATAFAQAPELAQLKDKLLQLEQMMDELKGQIAAAEQTQKTPAAPFAPTTPAASRVPTPQVPVDHLGKSTLSRVVASENPDS